MAVPAHFQPPLRRNLNTTVSRRIFGRKPHLMAVIHQLEALNSFTLDCASQSSGTLQRGAMAHNLTHPGAPAADKPLGVTQERNHPGLFYSLRRATTGSTRDARRAGARHARTATPRRISDTTVIVGMKSGRKP